MNIKLDDITVYLETCGNGFPLVLLHGNGEDLTIFQNQINYFSSFYNVIAIDSRGHGKTTRGTKELNFNALSDDLIETLDQLSVPMAHIIGFSDGGNTALHLALKAPERVKSLVLVGANLIPGGLKNNILLLIRLSVYRMKIQSLFDKRILNKKEQYELMLHHPKLSWEQLAIVQSPTLVIAGDNDMIKDEHTLQLAAAIPNAELEIVPDADHFVLFKKPETVNKRILDFLLSQQEIHT